MFSKLVLTFVLCGGFFSGFLSSNYSHIFEKYTVHGIDVSHHQRHIHWNKVSEHEDFQVKFCFMKATEGATHTDTQFKNYWEKSTKACLIRGAYHFYSHSSSPLAQANHFISTVKLNEGDLAPVLDFETESAAISVSQTRKNLMKWLTIVGKEYNTKPIIYTNSHIYNKYIKGYFEGYHLWIADYNVTDIRYKTSDKQIKLWQFTERGRIAGIGTNVDINAFVGDEHEFELLRIPTKKEDEKDDILEFRVGK